MTEQEIFHKGSLKKLVKKNSITVYGKTYPNINEAIRKLKPKSSRKTIKRIIDMGFTPEEAFEMVANYE